MMSYLNNKYYENLVIVGYFNFGSINWKGWTASGNDKNSDELFLDNITCIQPFILSGYINE